MGEKIKHYTDGYRSLLPKVKQWRAVLHAASLEELRKRTPTWLIFHAIREHIKIWQGNLLSHGKIKPPNYEKQGLSSPFFSMSNKNNEWEF